MPRFLKVLAASLFGSFVGTVATIVVVGVGLQEAIQWEERQWTHIVNHIQIYFLFLMVLSFPVIVLSLGLMLEIDKVGMMELPGRTLAFRAAWPGALLLGAYGVAFSSGDALSPLLFAIGGGFYGAGTAVAWAVQRRKSELV